MENKINIAELLKDCPQGMELDCALFEGLEFDSIEDNKFLPIRCRIKNSKGGYHAHNFTEYGQWDTLPYAKCVIFPKGKTTWEGFVPPCKFKEGDILSNDMYIAIFYKADRPYTDFKRDVLYYHCWYNRKYNEFKVETDYGIGHIEEYKLATKEEKLKLFQAIKDNGYHWNEETKTLEKLVKPSFKVGDRVRSIYNNFQYDITDLTDTHYTLVEVECKFKYTEDIIEDKNWELVPNKFDITTLKPFDKVLVRDSDKKYWSINFFGFYNEITEQFHCLGNTEIGWDECIPYEVNKELLGTTNNPKEYGSE